MTPRARFLGLATNFLQGSADLADTGRVRTLLLIFTALLGSCMSSGNDPVMTTLISQPAGATCTTETGEVFTLPADVPCCPEGGSSFDIALDGHAPRRVQITTGHDQPNLSSLLMADVFGGLVGGATRDEVEVVDGAATIELDPLAEPQPEIATMAASFRLMRNLLGVRAESNVRTTEGSTIGSLPSPSALSTFFR